MNGYENVMVQVPPEVLFVVIVWSLFWKGMALWHAAKNNQRNWFIIMLILSTIGIVEILYLFVFTKKKFSWKSLKFWS